LRRLRKLKRNMFRNKSVSFPFLTQIYPFTDNKRGFSSGYAYRFAKALKNMKDDLQI
jgi:hypothetical protein